MQTNLLGGQYRNLYSQDPQKTQEKKEVNLSQSTLTGLQLLGYAIENIYNHAHSDVSLVEKSRGSDKGDFTGYMNRIMFVEMFKDL